MVVSWIWYSIWKFWVIYVLVFLVFQIFSTAELISLVKTVNLAVWAFSLIFLHFFTLFGIDMHYIYHISLIATTFGPLWNMGFSGPDPSLHLALCLKQLGPHTPLAHFTSSLWSYVWNVTSFFRTPLCDETKRVKILTGVGFRELYVLWSRKIQVSQSFVCQF